jgi:hypothetical protein
MCHIGIGWFVDHKVLVYWVAAIAPGPLPSYGVLRNRTGPSQPRSLPHRRPMEWTKPRLTVAQ